MRGGASGTGARPPAGGAPRGGPWALPLAAHAPGAARLGAARPWALRLIAAALAPLLAGCVLQDVALTDPEDVLVAEVLVQVRDDGVAANRPRVFALLHRTVGAAGGPAVPGARVVIRRGDLAITLTERQRLADCLGERPEEYGVSCYRAVTADENRIRAGDSLSLEIETPDGRRLQGFTVVPGDFQLTGSPPSRTCVLAPATPLELLWTRSPGAWAYVAETSIQNFRDALNALGFPVEQDRIHLFGLAISQADTTITFPREFGLIERFTEDNALLVALQQGLPPGALAQITVAATERNYANWQRGGLFNPSGQVRVPSLRGDGTGFFGATVVRTLTVWVPPRTDRSVQQDAPCP